MRNIIKKVLIFNILLIMSMNLTGCATILFGSIAAKSAYVHTFPDKLAPKATKEDLEKVKQTFVRMLEAEYQQPFKVIDFKYSYDVHMSTWEVSGRIEAWQYGEYWLKIQAVNNPFIVIEIHTTDNTGLDKMYADYKKSFINKDYCSAFDHIFNQSYYSFFDSNRSTVKPFYMSIDDFLSNIDFCNNTQYETMSLIDKKEYLSFSDVSKLTDITMFTNNGWNILVHTSAQNIAKLFVKLYPLVSNWKQNGDYINITLFGLLKNNNKFAVKPLGYITIPKRNKKYISSAIYLSKYTHVYKDGNNKSDKLTNYGKFITEVNNYINDINSGIDVPNNDINANFN